MTFADAAEIPNWLHVSRETTERLREFAVGVRKWTSAINLISKPDINHLWHRHILDSAQLFEFAPPGARLWADLGSGGGFPGLVIAILAKERMPDLAVHLVESDIRKATFLGQVARDLNLFVTTHVSRIDKLIPLGADVVSARALAPMPQLCSALARHMSADGIALLLKGASVEPEIRACDGIWDMEIDRFPSRMRADGVILSIKGLRHV